MDLANWLLIGAVVGVVSTAWQKRLSVSRLILSMVIGIIGSFSGGVVGYLMFGSRFEGFDFSVFSFSFIQLFLFIIIRKKVRLFIVNMKKQQTEQLLLPERSTLSLSA